MTSLGNVASCKKLMAEELGSLSNPIKTIHRASTDIYQNDLNWVDADTGHTRLRLKEDGHLQIVEDLEFFSGPSITTGTKKYSIGLNGSAFVIRDEVSQVDLLTLDETDSIVGLTAQLAALQAKQNALLVNGTPINNEVLNTFALTSGGDGVNYATSLVTAGALENFIENVLQPSLLTVQAGQSPGVRVGTVTTSNVNVPSCLAVSNAIATASLFTLDPGGNVSTSSTVKIPKVEFNNTASAADQKRSFTRFKTTPTEILADNDDQPFSCQAFLASGSTAAIASTNANGYHLLPPSGATIESHLSTLLYTSKVKFGQGAGSTSQGADAVGIGLNAGQNQSDLCISIGRHAGRLNQQWACIAIGDQAGETQQGGINSFSIAIGASAGQTHQDFNAIAMGQFAGGNNQSHDAIAIGSSAGYNQQGINAIAIGNGAGQQSQGANAISIGHFPPGAGNSVSTAGQFQQSANSIVLNASGNTLNGSLGASRFYVDPIRAHSTTNTLYYDATTKEVTYGPNSTSVSLGGTTYTLTLRKTPIQHVQYNTTSMNLRVGNSSTGNHLNHTYGSWVTIHVNSAPPSAQQYLQSITLSKSTSEVKIETNIHARIDRSLLAFRIVRIVAGVSNVVVAGSEQHGRSIVPDDDHFTYCISVVDTPGATAVEYQVEAYATDATSNSTGGIFEINWDSGIGTSNNSGFLLTEFAETLVYL